MAPIMRNLWWWLGCRPVSRECFAALLRKGRSVALCPGGVQARAAHPLLAP